jgi:hypothetical protein
MVEDIFEWQVILLPMKAVSKPLAIEASVSLSSTNL